MMQLPGVEPFASSYRALVPEGEQPYRADSMLVGALGGKEIRVAELKVAGDVGLVV